MAPPTATALPHRPMLRPGFHLTRRDDAHLQVGLDPPHRVVLPDEPGVRRLVEDLVAGRAPDPTTGAARRALSALVAADLVVDAEALSRDLAGPVDGPAVRWAYAARGAAAPARLAARAVPVGVLAAPEREEPLVRLLRSAGCLPVGPGTQRSAASVWLVVADAEPARASVDPLVRDGVPHLLVRGGDTAVTVGPFVVPGATACLRCVDAHLSESDPRRSVVVEQLARRSGATPASRDPVLGALATAWAVRDLLGFLEGDEPASWSATIRVGPDPVPTPHRWTRHPHCGCAWGDALAAG